MDDKTEGIALQSVRYGDTSLIVRIYTRQYGLRSYMLKGAFNHGSKNRAALFQNLNVVSYVEVNNKKSGTLNYLKDAQLALVYHSLPFVMNKSAIMMYVSELLSKTITEEVQNEELYDFITGALQWLDLVENDYAGFPLFFTLELTRHLGFYPKANHQAGYCFDMMEGSFSRDYPLHPYYLDAEAAALLNQLLNIGIDELSRRPLRLSQRRELLDGLIVYMRLHAPVMKDFHSHEVLKSVLE